jgi:hypothetical protein
MIQPSDPDTATTATPRSPEQPPASFWEAIAGLMDVDCCGHYPFGPELEKFAKLTRQYARLTPSDRQLVCRLVASLLTTPEPHDDAAADGGAR